MSTIPKYPSSTTITTSGGTITLPNPSIATHTVGYVSNSTIASGSVSNARLNDSVRTDVGEALAKMGIHSVEYVNKCTACNEANKNIVVSYSRYGFLREICRECCQNVFDRFLGININPEVEKVLYGSKETIS